MFCKWVGRWAQQLGLQQTMRYVEPADVGDKATAFFLEPWEGSQVWDVGTVPFVSLQLCVCVADMPSGSELCQRGGGKAIQHQRERARGPKTKENW